MQTFIDFFAFIMVLGSLASGIASGYYAAGVRVWGNDPANLIASLQYHVLATVLAIGSAFVIHFNGNVSNFEGYEGFFAIPSALLVLAGTALIISSTVNVNKTWRGKTISRRLYLASLSIYAVSAIAIYATLAFFWSAVLGFA